MQDDPLHQIFTKLDVTDYSSYNDFEKATLLAYREMVLAVPSLTRHQFTDVLRWAYKQGWIEIDGNTYRIRCKIIDRSL